MIMLVRFLFLISLTFQTIHGKTDDEVINWMFRQALECNKKYHLTPDEMQTLHKYKVPETKNAKCLVACVFRQAKFMNDKGMFDVEAAIAQAETDYEGDTMKIENSKKLLEICKKVNSETVSDGKAGCDRGQYLYKCLVENGPQLGFPLQNMY